MGMLLDARCHGDMKYYKKKFLRRYTHMMPNQRKKFHLSYVGRTFEALARYCKARDGYRCFSCGSDDTRNLHAHHIQPKSLFPELFFEEDNIITLCHDCHKEVHGHSVGARR